MSSLRLIGATLVALACLASSAGASPLLSGYGGPGSGDQSVLGSQLLPGPGKGTSDGGGGGGPTSLRARPPVSSAQPGNATQPPRAAGAGPAASGAGGSSSASDRGGRTRATPAAGTAAAAGARKRARAAKRAGDRRRAARERRAKADGTPTKRSVPAPDAPRSAAPNAVGPIPGAETTAGALPVSGADLGLAALVLLGLLAVAAGSARLSRLEPAL